MIYSIHASEPGLWTVGAGDPMDSDSWDPVSDHDNFKAAEFTAKELNNPDLERQYRVVTRVPHPNPSGYTDCIYNACSLRDAKNRYEKNRKRENTIICNIEVCLVSPWVSGIEL